MLTKLEDPPTQYVGDRFLPSLAQKALGEGERLGLFLARPHARPPGWMKVEDIAEDPKALPVERM